MDLKEIEMMMPKAAKIVAPIAEMLAENMNLATSNARLRKQTEEIVTGTLRRGMIAAQMLGVLRRVSAQWDSQDTSPDIMSRLITDVRAVIKAADDDILQANRKAAKESERAT